MNKEANISELIGKTFSSFYLSDSELILNASDGTSYKFYHEQDCCEGVYIDDIDGDLYDLMSHPILQAEEAENTKDTFGKVDADETSFTWTFYKFATIKGYVTIKWLGVSNGYYSERVSLIRIK